MLEHPAANHALRSRGHLKSEYVFPEVAHTDLCGIENKGDSELTDGFKAALTARGIFSTPLILGHQ
jgi:hypothetical protein